MKLKRLASMQPYFFPYLGYWQLIAAVDCFELFDNAQYIDRGWVNRNRILKPGGQIMILDLLQHHFEQARELYGDLWLGLPESDLHRWLEAAGFKKIEISVVAREEQPPHFATILAAAEK